MYRKIIYILMFSALFGCSARQNDAGTPLPVSENLVSEISENQADTFAVARLQFVSDDALLRCLISADYPENTSAPAGNSVAEYISETLGGTYAGSPADGQTMLDFYGKEAVAGLSDDEHEHQYLFETNIRKIYETEKFVTYTTLSQSYFGGAHGMHTFSGVTVRKSDGRRFGHDLLHRQSPAACEADGRALLIKEGLRAYFAEGRADAPTDEELKDFLLTDVPLNFLPWPQMPPFFAENGVAFVYNPYEIAPYAAGCPTFTVPYDKMRPYLTAAARALLE